MLHAEHKIKISVGGKKLGKVTNKTTKWGTLINKLSVPQIDQQHTLEQYLKLTTEEQGDLKNVGFFVGGQCDNGIRRIGSIQERWLLTLDIDEAEPEMMDILDFQESGLAKFEFFAYSTRKHTSESPRIRVVVPLSKPCPAEAYHALSRICAEMLKPDMEGIDPVSYRVTQLMYYPSVCKDAEFYKNHNQGELMDPDFILEQFGDWRDHTKLPRSESDSSKYNDPSTKPEDPEEKEGFIGAFCKVYNVPKAIKTFLKNVYINPKVCNGSTRYTYALGTTFHGAVVYDDDKFLYSNHMHDPASGHSQNAFDLVRIHLFGKLDADIDSETKLTAKPSFKKMVELLKDDSKVKKTLISANYDINRIMGQAEDDSEVWDQVADDDFDQDGTEEQDSKDEAKKEKKDKKSKDSESSFDWIEKLTLDSKSNIESTVENVVLILRNDPRFKGVCKYNEMRDQLVLVRDLDIKVEGIKVIKCKDDEIGDIQVTWSDIMDKYVHYILEADRGEGKMGYKMNIPEYKVLSAIQIAFENDRYNPIKNYLESLKWDGKPRLESLLHDYLGCENDLYHKTIAKMTLIAAVCRVYEPGHKFDQMLIIEGGQGIRKSSFFKELAIGCFGEMTADIENTNKTIESMHNKWFLEFGELHQLKKAEVTRLKEFLSTNEDRGRMAYERKVKSFPRRCIFVGTTNEEVYLRDKSGNRRFWPCKATVKTIDIDRLVKERDQIWAEAFEAYKQMRIDKPRGQLELVPRGDFEEKAIKQQALRMDNGSDQYDEILKGQIESFLNEPCSQADADHGEITGFDNLDDDTKVLRTKTCVKEIWDKCLRDVMPVLNRSNSDAIIRAIRAIDGWEIGSTRTMGSYGRQMSILRK